MHIMDILLNVHLWLGHGLIDFVNRATGRYCSRGSDIVSLRLGVVCQDGGLKLGICDLGLGLGGLGEAGLREGGRGQLV